MPKVKRVDSGLRAFKACLAVQREELGREPTAEEAERWARIYKQCASRLLSYARAVRASAEESGG